MTAVFLPVVGVDLSLTATGIATAAGARTITSSGRAGAPLRARYARLADIALAVSNIIETNDRRTLVVIEAPAFSRTTGHQHDRSGLWWMVVRQLLSSGHLVAEVTPSALKKYATGKGNAGKGAMVDAAARRLPDVVTGGDDNAVDALWLRAMGMHRYGAPLCPMPALNAQALDAVQWPDVDRLTAAQAFPELRTATESRCPA